MDLTGPLTTAMARTAVAIADRAVICDIQTEGNQFVDDKGVRWYDISPMVDTREHSAEFVDMASEGLAYALARRLIEFHPIAFGRVRLLTSR